MPTVRRIIIGLGNPDRGDDAVGRVVAQQLRGTLPADIEVAEERGDATALMARFADANAVFLIDASASGAPAGTIRRFDVTLAALPQGLFGLSTHGFGLAAAIELARALGQLPPQCVVYAVEGASFETGAPLSPAVAAAVTEAADRLRAEIAPIFVEP
ncbi:hydrogenase maturation protease [Desertibaculum subflavum]|uniref:hydrogenase maturation protease n=1 Tax=Desertibaculum subflavum TaxID=2268458 RepID=UPI0034D1DDBE